MTKILNHHIKLNHIVIKSMKYDSAIKHHFTLALLLLITANIVLAQHVKIPGTQVEMIQPEGFTMAGKFAGFQQQETQSSIFVSTIPIPEEALYQALDGIKLKLSDSEALKTQNMQLISNQEIQLKHSAATLLELQQTVGANTFKKWILILTNTNEILLINGVFPLQHNAALDGKVLDTLLSVQLNNKEISTFEAVNFTLDEHPRFIIDPELQIPTLIMLKEPDAPHPSLPEDHPVLIVSQAFSTTVINDLVAFSNERILQHPNTQNITIEHTSHQQIDDLQAFEITAKAIDSTTQNPLTIWQLILADIDTYYIAVGITAYTSKNSDLKDFRAQLNSFKRKPK